MRTPHTARPAVERVSPLELFFDLVFVFTLTRITEVLAHPHGASDYAETLLVFMTLMWIYDGFVWLTSHISVDNLLQRQLMFAAMAGFFVMALSIATVFDAGGLPYALGYLLVVLIHLTLFSKAQGGAVQAILGVAPFNLTSALLVLAAAFVPPPVKWLLWTAAVAVLFVATFLRRERSFEISPTHFVERHGLLMIVALGESILAVGFGAEGLTLTPALLVTAVLALALSGSMWWTYFDSNQRLAEQHFVQADKQQRNRIALIGFGYAHFMMIFGIILIAAGLKVGVAHPLGHPEAIGIWNLACGLALCLLGDAWYHRTLGLGRGYLQLIVAALTLLTIPLGLAFGALPHLALCLLLRQPLWLLEGRFSKKPAHDLPSS